MSSRALKLKTTSQLPLLLDFANDFLTACANHPTTPKSRSRKSKVPCLETAHFRERVFRLNAKQNC